MPTFKNFGRITITVLQIKNSEGIYCEDITNLKLFLVC